MKNVIITGTTGMVGKAVLLECLDHPSINKVLVVNRQSLKIKHDKLEEILLNDFTKIASKSDELKNYDACFYCMGVSVLGLNEEQYTKIIYNTTKAFVDILYKLNPKIIFNYVSGTGTDTTEKRKIMWARVKGKTENAILKQGFLDAYMFRLGAILPEKGIRSKTAWYNTFYFIMCPLFPFLRLSRDITTTTKFGLAMINTLFHPQESKYLSNRDINLLAEKGEKK